LVVGWKKLYLFDSRKGVMKELSIILYSHDLSKATEILRKHKVGGMAFYEIHASGRTKRKEIPEMVRMYQTGRMVTPEHEKRTKVEALVPDSLAEQIVQDLVSNLGSESDPGGLVLLTDVTNAYELGTKHSGESLLTTE
jgi:nitrogen regulatory protein P-II 1